MRFDFEAKVTDVSRKYRVLTHSRVRMLALWYRARKKQFRVAVVVYPCRMMLGKTVRKMLRKRVERLLERPVENPFEEIWEDT